MTLTFHFIMGFLGFLWISFALSPEDFRKTIIVGKNGQTPFKTVQSAIDSIPNDNLQWIKIHIQAGTFREQVRIPRNKGFILLEGEGRDKTTLVESKYINVETWNLNRTTRFEKGFITDMDEYQKINLDALEDSATFVSEANNIIVKDITLKNDYSSSTGLIKRAVAADIKGDMTSFYNCGFVSFQDTLYDRSGRHYFSNCYIEGHVDYIFGHGQSIYERCTIFSATNKKGSKGWITAQGRAKSTDPDGFLFKDCDLTGPGLSYLGRAWGSYSKVVFYRSKMANIIVPEGWDQWDQSPSNLEYSEYDCSGPGSSLSSRVNWMKTLSSKEIELYSGNLFIDNQGWINDQPK
ncbi:pectin methylesterase, family CE8 [Zostera marina]|uniref:pectinesterase n=1 Tax=Zostera marina TaxID=29655 RepID=A0A0K9NME2_ZOSMR|nr:pectin methylesterase, family CE8 [Zostera marina]KMZ57959.1 pectin methylesterase, family CE8 [Zostera marina]